MSKTAIITGIQGQDASYLSEILLEKDYKVIGLRRRSANPNFENIEHLMSDSNFSVEICDITDPSSVFSVINKYKPDELYNLAAQSHVKVSFDNPIHTFQVNAEAVLNILEGIRQFSPSTKLYQASTSEMFGDNISAHYDVQGCSVRYDGKRTPWIEQNKEEYFFQDEFTPFSPQSPYAIAKVAAHQSCKLYRNSYDTFVCCGVLYNHESPRRGKEFVTRKITDYVARLHTGKTADKLQLGNLEAKRDWGHSRDYMEAAWMMLQRDKPDDFVIATGETHSIEELCQEAFSYVGLDWHDYVTIDPKFMRPSEVPFLLGNAGKAKQVLGWKPKVKFEELIKEMVESDIKKYNDR